jgi:hypothetical protein
MALDVADQQNAYNITIAVKSIVELFRLVKHKKELYQKILAFLISYNHSTARIYGYYALINRNKTTFYYYFIKKFDFISKEDKDK